MADPQRIAIQHERAAAADGAGAGDGRRGCGRRSTRCSPASYDDAGGDAERLRVVLDQVSLLTDAQAMARHRRLTS